MAEGERLTGRLQSLIEAEGPITFAAFMEAALYDPDEGFYARSPVGEKGDFVTSPHVSAAFGSLLARQLEEMWELLDKPEPFWAIEFGAGDGTLSRQILQELEPALARATKYVAVERSAGAREALLALAASWRTPAQVSVAADRYGAAGIVGGSGEGVVLANELLDNVPFHRLRGAPTGVVELYVTHGADGFALVEGPPSSDRVAALAPSLHPGGETTASPAALDLVDAAARLLSRSYLLLFDYGLTPAAGALVHGYRAHRVEHDVLSDPGSRDITAGVDFAAIARHATAAGHSVWGPVSQRDALLNLGFRTWDEEARSRQFEAASKRRGLETMRIYSARSRASLLVDPFGLGGFQVLCLGVGIAEPPIAVRAR